MLNECYDETKSTIDCNRLVSDFLNSHDVVKCGKAYYVYSEETGIFDAHEIEDVQLMVARQYEHVSGKVYHVKYSRQITELLKIRIDVVDEMDWDKDKLCLSNCVIDLSTYEVFDFSPEYRFTNKSDIVYDSKATCPVFDKFMNQICLGNIKRRQSLEEFMGLCLTKDIGYGTAMILKGNGANGKSVLCNTITSLAGNGYYATVTLKDLNSFGSGKIPGKKLIIMTEVNRASSADLMTNELKQVISGEIMDCNIKHCQNVDMRPFAKVLILTNHEIGFISDDSEGALRRIFICPLEYYVPPDERDYQLENKLNKELSGIFNVALSGLRRLRNNGYQYSGKEESDKIVNEQLRYENPLRAFVREKFTYSHGNFITYNTIAAQYKKWCQKYGLQYDLEDTERKTEDVTKKKAAMSKRIFKEIANYYNIERSTSNGVRGIKNVKLKNIIK